MKSTPGTSHTLDTQKTVSKIKADKWLEWCAMLNQHTSLTELWQMLKKVSGKRSTKVPTHPKPKEEAVRFADTFSNRSSNQQLPPSTIRIQNDLRQQRWDTINHACNQKDDTDTPFTTQELKNTKHKGKDTAPGADGITYTMINNMGTSGEAAYLHLTNTTCI
ncbi:hypothetical protein SK128_008994 [Halocaridina rubra]|uniref:Uncharacterized protein n=1 Tax=Halocaridina rubra TaxID=373956 RepID=A0AAN9AB87_HALRR